MTSPEEDDLFSYPARAADALAARGVTVTQLADALEIDLRTLGEVEVYGSESAAHFCFAGRGGMVRVLLAPAAFFTLQRTFSRP